MNTPVVFYRRLMWLYNHGISARHDNTGHMFICQETEGTRGSNEVAASIYAFLKLVNCAQYDHIHSFSNCCGGQNRNKTMTTFFMLLFETTNIQSWTHTFLESGHSYLTNDTDFKKIQKNKDTNQSIFTKGEWTVIIKWCNFHDSEMQGRFYASAGLQRYRTNLQRYRTYRTIN